jgi:hypothetical protein
MRKAKLEANVMASVSLSREPSASGFKNAVEDPEKEHGATSGAKEIDNTKK